LIYGIAPAFQATKVSVTDALKEGGRLAAGSRAAQRARRILVVAEIALALTVLAGAGLMIRSYSRLSKSNLGFDRENVLWSTIMLPQNSYPSAVQSVSFFRTLQKNVMDLPGVESSGMVSTLPVYDRLDQRDFQVAPQTTASADERSTAVYRYVTAGYFTVMRIPLREGRMLNDDDRDTTQPVALVNDTLAKHFWPHESAIGKQIELRNEYSERSASSNNGAVTKKIIVVGVVGDTRQIRDWNRETMPEMFFPLAQSPGALRNIKLIVRTQQPPLNLLDPIRQLLRRMDRSLPPGDSRSMHQVIEDAYGTERLALVLLTVFAAVALVLAVAGVYALLAYTVTLQSHEIGVRMALGAQPREVLRHTLAQGVKLALPGLLIGVAGGLLLSSAMSSFLYEVKSGDPLTFAGSAILLFCLALFGCFVPARRAMRVDPIIALRHE